LYEKVHELVRIKLDNNVCFALLAKSFAHYGHHQANIVQKLAMSVCPSVPPHETSWLSRDGFWWNFVFFENQSRKLKFH